MKLAVKCPQCNSKFDYYQSKARPFCSTKCKEIDLGRWFLEDYKVASKSPLSDEDLEQCLQELEGSYEGDDEDDEEEKEEESE